VPTGRGKLDKSAPHSYRVIDAPLTLPQFVPHLNSWDCQEGTAACPGQPRSFGLPPRRSSYPP